MSTSLCACLRPSMAYDIPGKPDRHPLVVLGTFTRLISAEYPLLVQEQFSTDQHAPDFGCTCTDFIKLGITQ
ncbi:hypothetical protein SAMN05216369_3149 [Marinobacter antarcticus]|uniref:Uncharacterized protein n=1 Tax=Marinobacter antarcticus TaxID=564117 RepID=A0A1M6VEJ3_9GAMM|nr:hypothetical protein SAMN05216369_3149 [Marinobacter antarcticus]